MRSYSVSISTALVRMCVPHSAYFLCITLSHVVLSSLSPVHVISFNQKNSKYREEVMRVLHDIPYIKSGVYSIVLGSLKLFINLSEDADVTQ